MTTDQQATKYQSGDKVRLSDLAPNSLAGKDVLIRMVKDTSPYAIYVVHPPTQPAHRVEVTYEHIEKLIEASPAPGKDRERRIDTFVAASEQTTIDRVELERLTGAIKDCYSRLFAKRPRNLSPLVALDEIAGLVVIARNEAKTTQGKLETAIAQRDVMKEQLKKAFSDIFPHEEYPGDEWVLPMLVSYGSDRNRELAACHAIFKEQEAIINEALPAYGGAGTHWNPGNIASVFARHVVTLQEAKTEAEEQRDAAVETIRDMAKANEELQAAMELARRELDEAQRLAREWERTAGREQGEKEKLMRGLTSRPAEIRPVLPLPELASRIPAPVITINVMQGGTVLLHGTENGGGE